MTGASWVATAADILGSLAGELMGILVVPLILVALAVLAYFVLRRLGVDVRVTGGQAGVPAGTTGRSTGGSSRISIETIAADPVVYRLDTETLERARARIAMGEDLDAVCRDINPDYGTWGAAQREAFRRVLDAALREGDRA